ncbi:MAG: amino acid transporter [Vampirovibrio sp.]|jgi:APA family basic amino acid/polyamine antiporter|nr:amino acid transporter [Vampirovibrio sp.]
MKQGMFRTKPVEHILGEAAEHQGGLKRVLTAVDLTAIGVGAIIGAGIFVLTGTAARDAAGPAIMLSYVFAGIGCILAALCYAEFATRLPISGSAYTYAYASVGEVFAWIIGWDLILEYTIGSSTVAVGWTHYLSEFLKGFGLAVPEFLLALHIGGLTINVAAALLVVLLTVLLCVGIKESSRFNALMVIIKLAVVLFVIFAGIPWVKPDNWNPFFPYGFGGIFQGAALIFFAYIGFDAVSTAAEEVKNPQRDLPIGIITSLVVCTLLYVAVSAVITGMVPYKLIDAGAPLAAAFGSVGNTLAQKLIGLGGFVGLTTVVLILLMSQPRIWFAMARDGLMFPWFSKVHPRFRTPFNASILTGVIAAVMAAAVPMSDLHHMVSIGTLFAFVVVSASVLIMRYKTEENPSESVFTVLKLALGLGLLCFGLAYDFSKSFSVFGFPVSMPEFLATSVLVPGIQIGKLIPVGVGAIIAAKPMIQLFLWKQVNVPSTFRCPWVPLIPVIAMGANMYMMAYLNVDAWLRLVGWLLFGLAIYAWYGVKHSKLAK